MPTPPSSAATSWTGRWRAASASGASTASSRGSQPTNGATTSSSWCRARAIAACSESGSVSRKTNEESVPARWDGLLKKFLALRVPVGREGELGLRGLLHFDVAAVAPQALEVGGVLPPRHGAHEDLPDVTVAGVGTQAAVIADLLGRFLADEEVAGAAHDPPPRPPLPPPRGAAPGAGEERRRRRGRPSPCRPRGRGRRREGA